MLTATVPWRQTLYIIVRSPRLSRSFRPFHMICPPPDEASHTITCTRPPTWQAASSTGPHVLFFFFSRRSSLSIKECSFFLFLQWNCIMRRHPPCSSLLRRSVWPVLLDRGEDEWLGLGCCTFDFVLFARRSPGFSSVGVPSPTVHLVSGSRRIS